MCRFRPAPGTWPLKTTRRRRRRRIPTSRGWNSRSKPRRTAFNLPRRILRIPNPSNPEHGSGNRSRSRRGNASGSTEPPPATPSSLCRRATIKPFRRNTRADIRVDRTIVSSLLVVAIFADSTAPTRPKTVISAELSEPEAMRSSLSTPRQLSRKQWVIPSLLHRPVGPHQRASLHRT